MPDSEMCLRCLVLRWRDWIQRLFAKSVAMVSLNWRVSLKWEAMVEGNLVVLQRCGLNKMDHCLLTRLQF